MTDIPMPNYSYRATVARIIDGDTIDVDLDLGFSIKARKRLRFLGIDTYEMRGSERELGKLATARLTELLKDKTVIVQTSMDATGKYGRVLAVVWTIDELDNSVNVNATLLEEGHATAY